MRSSIHNTNYTCTPTAAKHHNNRIIITTITVTTVKKKKTVELAWRGTPGKQS